MNKQTDYKLGKIAFLDQYAFVGGGQAVLLNTIGVAVRIFEKVVVVAPGGGSFEDKIKSEFSDAVDFRPSSELQLTHGKKSLVDYLKMFRGTFSQIITYIANQRDADVIYVNGPRLFPSAILFSFFCKTPAYYHIHINHTGLEKFLVKIASKSPFTNKLIFNSNYVLQTITDTSREKNEDDKSILIENSLSLTYSGQIFQNRFLEFDRRLVLAVVGTVRPEKGQDIAVRLAKTNPRVAVHFIGRVGQGAEDWAEELLAARPSNLTVHGDILDIPSFINKIGVNIYLVPSTWAEPFGLVAIEGMALSCITIVSKQGGLLEIANNTGAFTFDSDEQLHEVINKLECMSNSELLDIAKSQFEKTISKYHISNYIKQMAVLMKNSSPATASEIQ